MKTPTTSIQRRKIHSQLPLLCLLGLMALPGTRAVAGNDNAADASLVPPNARFHGLTYGEWVVEWNQWYFANVLVPNSPFIDTTGGTYFATGQSGPVWFLPWIGYRLTERSITIPAGSSLLFPVHAIDSMFQLPADATDEQVAAEEQVLLDLTSTHIVNVVVEIDGVQVQDPWRYQVVSPRFDVDLPGGSLNWWNAPAGHYGPVTAEGLFYLVKPLCVGQHTIQFGSDQVNVGPHFDGHWEGIYHVTIVPHSEE